MTRQRFVVLDRDGTVIEECHYLSDPRQVKLISGVADGLRELSRMGLGLVVITNQSGVGRGFFDEMRVRLVHERMGQLLEAEGLHLDGIYFCPHKPEDDCPCRKPRPGLVENAEKDLGFDPQTAFFIGDKPCDIELGRRIGATTFLVRTGYGTQVAQERMIVPDYIVDDILEAAGIIENLLVSEKNERK
jgi:D-glycero-D-manno-heptose 1,7-bisphosphate phosphatase